MGIRQFNKLLVKTVGAAVFASILAMGAPGVWTRTVHAQGCSHEYFAWEELEEATCSKTGKKVKVCRDCEAVLETETIAKLKHKGTWKKTKEATCTAQGVKSRICQNCGEVIETESIAQKNHSYKWEVTKEATCAEEGRKEYKCRGCTEVSETATIPKKKHKMGSWSVTNKASCSREGTKVRCCTECGTAEREIIKATGKHKYGTWSVKSISVQGQNLKVTQIRACNGCRCIQSAAGTTSNLCRKLTAANSSKCHGTNSYYYKFTPRTGRIVILCPDCHKSVTGKITASAIKFTRPKKDNSKSGSKNWKRI